MPHFVQITGRSFIHYNTDVSSSLNTISKRYWSHNCSETEYVLVFYIWSRGCSQCGCDSVPSARISVYVFFYLVFWEPIITLDTKLTMALAGCSGSCSANRWHTFSVLLPLFLAIKPKILLHTHAQQWINVQGARLLKYTTIALLQN